MRGITYRGEPVKMTFEGSYKTYVGIEERVYSLKIRVVGKLKYTCEAPDLDDAEIMIDEIWDMFTITQTATDYYLGESARGKFYKHIDECNLLSKAKINDFLQNKFIEMVDGHIEKNGYKESVNKVNDALGVTKDVKMGF